MARAGAIDSSRKREVAWLWLRPRLIPWTLLALGVGLALFVAYRSQQAVPPTATEAAFLALSSSTLSIFAGVTLSRIGRADPTLARSSVRRLFSIGDALRSCAEDLEGMPQDGVGGHEVARSLGRLDVVLSDVAAAIQDWNEVHPEALREAMSGSDQAQTEARTHG